MIDTKLAYEPVQHKSTAMNWFIAKLPPLSLRCVAFGAAASNRRAFWRPKGRLSSPDMAMQCSLKLKQVNI
eukprot:2668520-Amphidinium_carterae.1